MLESLTWYKRHHDGCSWIDDESMTGHIVVFAPKADRDSVLRGLVVAPFPTATVGIFVKIMVYDQRRELIITAKSGW